MLELKYIRNNLDTIKKALADRRYDLDVGLFEAHDENRRQLLVESEELKHQRNDLSQQVGELYKSGQGDKAEEIKAQVKDIGGRIKELDDQLAQIDADLQPWLMSLPNIPDESVPVGGDEEDNEVVLTWGEAPKFDFEPQAHWDLGEALGLLDFERAAKLSGARFAVMWRDLARLERALISFFLDVHTREHGYSEVWTPFMVNSPTMTGTGQLPKFAEDLFKIEGRDLWLIPTAEVPVTNLHAGEILTEDQLPLMYTAFTPCFRAEAGAYGKDTRGLIRQHQFDKVELVTFTTPEDSFAALERLTGHAEEILKRLNLHYRKVTLCTGDLGFSSAKTYDLEVWLPSVDTFREISSCSNFLDFQARRAGIRYKKPGQKGTEPVHTLNGSGLAVGRTLVAIMENYQRADGTIAVPEALRPYMGGQEIIPGDQS